MGGRPLTAMNLVGWPNGVIDYEFLGEVMRGGAEKIAESGATLVGGHSWDDAEPKYGLSVTGVIDPHKIVANSTAQAGDELVLTKPLGMGIITTAIKSDQVSEETLEQAQAIMATLNASAADAMLEVGAHAATDVTGFGLLGHLLEMTKGSHVTAEIFTSAVPILDEARALVAQDVAPGGTHRNLQALAAEVDFGALPKNEQLLLADAQTSGGLLIAVARDKLDQLLSALRARRTPAVAHIGRLLDDPSGRVIVRP
jgi:selenide,water dikinase